MSRNCLDGVITLNMYGTYSEGGINYKDIMGVITLNMYGTYSQCHSDIIVGLV